MVSPRPCAAGVAGQCLKGALREICIRLRPERTMEVCQLTAISCEHSKTSWSKSIS
jgi:hypothetical protein